MNQNNEQSAKDQTALTQSQSQQAAYHTQQIVPEEVIAVRKNSDGDIVQLKLTSGQVVDYLTAQSMVKNGQIAHLNVFRGRDNEEHLRSNADGRKDNNLDQLPEF